MNIFLSIDAGSSFVKVIASDENGSLLFSEKDEVDFIKTDGVFSEFEIENYWICCKNLLSRICLKLKQSKNKVRSISICSHGSTFVFLDRNERVLMPAVFWIDSRALKESNDLMKKINQDIYYNLTGQPLINAYYVPAKLVWFRKNRKDLFKKANKVIFIGDYLVFKLTGKITTSYSLSSVSGMLDIYNKKWSTLILNNVGIDENRMPTLVESGEIIENIKPDEAKDLEIPLSAIVMSTALDQAATALGAGNYKEGIVVETTGTVIALSTVIGKNKLNFSKKIPVFYHALKDKYLLLPWTKNGGIILNWFKNSFMENYNDERIYSLMDSEASDIEPGSEGLIFLPYILGADFPFFNEDVYGCYFGIKIRHKRAHFIRAILESIGYIINLNLNILEENGVKCNKFYSIGGGSKSKLWLQTKSDILNKNINLLKTTDDVGALGMNILAALKLGIYKNIKEAFKYMNETIYEFKPNIENSKIYSKRIDEFKRLNNLFFKNFH